MNKSDKTKMGQLVLLTLAGAERIPMSLEEYRRVLEAFDAVQSEDAGEDWFCGVDAEGMPFHLPLSAKTVGAAFEPDLPKYDETAVKLLIRYAGGLESIELPKENALALLGDGSRRLDTLSPVLNGTDVSGNPFRLALRPRGPNAMGLYSLRIETQQEKGSERSRC